MLRLEFPQQNRLAAGLLRPRPFRLPGAEALHKTVKLRCRNDCPILLCEELSAFLS
jgi:hypothetical protein